MKLNTHTLFAPLLVLSFVLGALVMSVPKSAEWEAATSDVFLFVGESSSSEASSSSSVASSASSSSSSSVASAASQSSDEQVPYGEYRHHETRMQEIIEEIVRERLRQRSSSSSAHPSAPGNPDIPLSFPFDFFFRLPKFNPSNAPCMEMRLPVFVPAKVISGSGTVKTSAPKDLPVSMEEDLDPETYGWVSSGERKDDGWVWEKIGSAFGVYFGVTGHEWIVWVIALIMFVCTVRMILRMHDRFVDFFIQKARDWHLINNSKTDTIL